MSQTLNYQHFRQEESPGMVMLFTLVTAMQEKLSERADQIKTVREEKQQKEAEAAGKQLFHGIPDTVENFLSWKAKFDAELLEIKKIKIIFRHDFWPFTFCMSASFSINILMVFPVVCIQKWLKL
uniref:RWD domain-containing protein n=1 Tax=Capra hircus TaxID=9925 RepID=A0A8C2SBV4_CAPHI